MLSRNEAAERVPKLRSDSCMYSTTTDSSSLDSDSEGSENYHVDSSTASPSSVATGRTTSMILQQQLQQQQNGELDGAIDTTKADSVTANLVRVLKWTIAGALGGYTVLELSLSFPFLMAPQAASWTYHAAHYTYDASISHFDNTVWTYGTDYLLAIIMSVLGARVLRQQQQYDTNIANPLCRRSATLLFTYAISVLAGGLAHQFYTTLEARNTWSFQLLWTICVGTVSAASCSMGMSATEVVRHMQKKALQQSEQQGRTQESSNWLQNIPHIPESFWIAFGLVITMAVINGNVSFQRPACDIFIAGTTQTPSSVVMMAFFLLVPSMSTNGVVRISNTCKLMGFAAFILNAPLLPAYPLLVQYTNLSLGAVNTLLHTNLCIAWSMQGLSLLHMARVLQVLDNDDDMTTEKLQQHRYQQVKHKVH